MKKKIVIWDWNGTLIDDTQLCFEIANTMLKERGLPLLSDVDAYRKLFRFPVISYYEAMGYSFQTESYDDISKEFVRLYDQSFGGCSLRANAVQTALLLKARGLMQVILSVTGQDKLLKQVGYFDLHDRFDGVLGTCDDLAHGKADLASAFIRDCGVAPCEVLFVGDTDHDVEVSKAVGCEAVLLSGGHQPKEKLLALGVPVLDDVRKLVQYVDESLNAAK